MEAEAEAAGEQEGDKAASLKCAPPDGSSRVCFLLGKFEPPPNAPAPSAEEFVDRTLAEADAALVQR